MTTNMEIVFAAIPARGQIELATLRERTKQISGQSRNNAIKALKADRLVVGNTVCIRRTTKKEQRILAAQSK